MTPLTNPGIDQGIAVIILMSQKLLKPATKEIVVDTASGGAWIHRTLRQGTRTGVNVITPGNIGNAIGIVEISSPVLVGIIGTAPPCDLKLRQEVGDIRQSTSPGLVRQS